MGKRKSNEDWVQEVSLLVGREYVFLDKYINSSTKLRVQHTKCGHLYEVKPNVFLNGRRCPKCAKDARKGKRVEPMTHSQWLCRVESLVGDEYTFHESYQGSINPLKVTHELCGYKYTVTPSDFSRGARCPKCIHKRTTITQSKTPEEFNKQVTEITKGEYLFLESYKGTHKSIRVKHTLCGYHYKVSPHDFLKGTRCPECLRLSKKKTQQEWDEQVLELGHGEYKFIECYKRDNEKIKCKHTICGHEYMVAPNTFINGARCPKCKYSKGEKEVERTLNELGIAFIPQKRFPGLRNHLPLSFDFFLPEHLILIEYQGQQHYKPIDFFGGKDTFIKQQLHDEMKKNYSSANGYSLIEIPYFEDVKTYLTSEIEKIRKEK